MSIASENPAALPSCLGLSSCELIRNRIESQEAVKARRLMTGTICPSFLPATFTYQHDANGNMTSDGKHAFAFDDENQLVSITITSGPEPEISNAN